MPSFPTFHRPSFVKNTPGLNALTNKGKTEADRVAGANRGSRFNPIHVIRQYNDRLKVLRNIALNQQQGASSPLLAPDAVPGSPVQLLEQEQDRETDLGITRNSITTLARESLSDNEFAADVQTLVNQHTHIGVDLPEIRSKAKRQAVLNILSNATHLRTVDLNAAAMPANFRNVLAASNAIAGNNPELSEFRLDVSNTNIGGAEAQALAATHLTSLNVSFNHIGTVGAQALASSTITSLNVSANAIGPAGAQALAANRTITSLNVSANAIGPAGAQALAANRTITSLNVSHNSIKDAGALALAANPNITDLNVSGNLIGSVGKRALAASSTITSLNVSYNSYNSALP